MSQSNEHCGYQTLQNCLHITMADGDESS